MDSIFEWLFGVEGFNLSEGGKWDLIFQSGIDTWIIFMVVIPLVVIGCWLIYRKEEGFLTKTKRIFLATMRIAAIMVLLTIFLEPVFSVERSLKRRGIVIVLLDDSKSMTIKDEQYDPETQKALNGVCKANPMTSTRLDLVKGMLKNSEIKFIDKLSEDNDVKLYGFSSGIRRDVKPQEINPVGDITQVGSAIMETINETKGRIVNAIVLITDGRSNAGIPVSSVAKILRERAKPIPVYAIAVGSEKPPPDIRLANLSAEPVVMLKDEVVIDYDYEQHGFDGTPVTVKLYAKLPDEREEKLVDKKEIKLPLSGIRASGELKYKPEKKGEHKLRLEISPIETEMVKTNNVLTHNITVVDTKLKVLYVEGKPRWEYIYLKNALIRDKMIDVWCYLVDSDIDFPQEISLGMEDKNSALKRFPSSINELEKYDVIILGDVDIRRLGEARRPGDPSVEWTKVADNLMTFVENLGGGIVFSSGSDFNPASYAGTPLEKLLPIHMSAVPPSGSKVYKEMFHPKLTPQGKDDPLMKMQGDAITNLEFWEDNDGKDDGLPGCFWYCPVKEAKPAAKVLAKHPNGSPLIVTQFYGRGRTMFVATDETWRWRRDTRDKYFYKFWGETLQRMRQGKIIKSKKFFLFLDPTCVLGDKVTIEAQVLDDDMQPSTARSHETTLKTPKGVEQKVELLPVKDKPGYYQGIYEPKDEGDYKISLGPTDKGTLEVFNVSLPKLEFDNPLMDKAGLTMLATETGGDFYYLYDCRKVFEPIQKLRASDQKEYKERELWDTPFMLIFFCALVIAEWIFRKRWGLA